jgi:predicted O-methyltransferase YrrM
MFIIHHYKFLQVLNSWLYGTVRALKPSLIIETGTCWGYITAFLASGLQDTGSGKLITIDYYLADYPHPSPNDMEKVRKNLEIAGVLDYVDIVSGEAVATLKEMASSGKLDGLDMVVLDDNHSYEQVKTEIDIVWDYLKPFGVIAGHDSFNSEFKGVHKAFCEAAEKYNAQIIWSPYSSGYCLMQKCERFPVPTSNTIDN